MKNGFRVKAFKHPRLKFVVRGNSLAKKTVSTLLLILALLPSSPAQSGIDGNYYWETSEGEKYQKYVDLTVTTSGGTVNISIDVVWTPGAHVEIGGTAATSQVITQPGPAGSQSYSITVPFEDGFKNKGSAKITITGNQCQLVLNATETNDSRATRQYSNYSLQRK